MEPAVDIAARLTSVRAGIAAAELLAGRAAGSVSLVAVGKTFGAGRIRPALDAGQRLFGENRVQEAAAKWPALREMAAGVRLHLIGPLQTNKVRAAVALFDVIETVDRPRLAAALAREFDRTGRRPACYVEVNTGDEPQKSGVAADEAGGFIEACLRDYALPVVGLMCLPPRGEDPEGHFGLLRRIAESHGLDRLSMGMTADYKAAIAHGATHVRLGTAIFGPRAPRPPAA